MSKASEWARTHTTIRHVVYARNGKDYCDADVLNDGWLRILTKHGHEFRTEQTCMSGTEALALARWILDTFGEADAGARA